MSAQKWQRVADILVRHGRLARSDLGRALEVHRHSGAGLVKCWPIAVPRGKRILPKLSRLNTLCHFDKGSCGLTEPGSHDLGSTQRGRGGIAHFRSKMSDREDLADRFISNDLPSDLVRAERADGFSDFIEDGWHKAAARVATCEEVRRVAAG